MVDFMSAYRPRPMFKEFPTDMAMRLIENISMDVAKVDIYIEHKDDDVRNAINERFKDLGINNIIQQMTLRLMYGSRAACVFVVDETEFLPYQMPIFADNFNYLEKINVLTFSPNINPTFLIHYMTRSPFDRDMGKPSLIVGGTYVNDDRCFFLNNNKESLYIELKKHTDALETLSEAITIMGKRMGVIVMKSEKINETNAIENLAVQRSANDILNAQNEDLLLMSSSDKIENIGLNIDKAKEAQDVLISNISMIINKSKSGLSGNEAGALATARENQRNYEGRIKQIQETMVPFLKKIVILLQNEKYGKMQGIPEFSIDEITFRFESIRELSQEEVQNNLKLELENLEKAMSIGLVTESVKSLFPSLQNIPVKNKEEQGIKDDARNVDANSEANKNVSS